MVNDDLINLVNVGLEENRATVTATGSEIVDTLGYNVVLFLVEISAVAAGDSSNYFDFTVEESDDDDFSDATEVTITGEPRLTTEEATAELTTTGRVLRINNTNMANTLKTFQVRVGTKRYLRVKWTETGTASATFSLIAIKAGSRH